MELIVITSMLCVTLSAFLTPSSSLQIQVQSSHGKANELQAHSLSALPRKLRLFEVRGYGAQDLRSSNKDNEYDAGESTYGKEQYVVHRSKGTRQEWVERADKFEFFTMDYSHVRRRRPVHNKSVPVSP